MACNYVGEIRIVMGYIYNPSGFDWMNFKITKENPLTFHHIQEVKYGGKKTIQNGALLSSDAHALLNYLERYAPDAYEELQEVFREINRSNQPPTNEIVQKVDLILYRVFFTTEFNIPMRQTFLQKRKEFIESRKELRMCLE